MSTPTSVLILGGYGSLGARTARMLRLFHPSRPIAIAGRDLKKARALAGELGTATALVVDLDRADLGLPEAAPFSAVVTAVKDLSLATLRFAQARGLPYVALSDGVLEVGPLVAAHVHRPGASPILMLGHGMGGVPTLAALFFARRFQSIEAIELGFVFDPEDPLGPASAVDMERIAKVGPAPLLLSEGRWRWVQDEAARRTILAVDGAAHDGQAVGLLDVLSLSTSLARSVRVDFAEGVTASRRRGGPPSHEVIIEIVGVRADGAAGRFRFELVDPEGYAALSARGVAVAVESLMGLAGRPPVGPGLYFPETIVEPAHLMQRLVATGVRVVP